MSRIVTPNPAGEIEWTEELVEPEGGPLTLDEVVLWEVDGKRQSSAEQSPSWLEYNALQSSVPQGTLLEVFFRVDSSVVEVGRDYTFRLVGSDPFDSATRFVTLEVR